MIYSLFSNYIQFVIALLFYSAISPFRLPKSTDITIGAPISAVTELIGSAPSNPGIRAIKLHTKAIAAPISKDAGISILWSEVRKTVRER